MQTHELTACSRSPTMLPVCTSTFRLHLLSRSFGEPLSAVIKAGTSLFEAATSGHITHRQAAGAAMDVVITADGLGQRATAPGRTPAKPHPHAAAGAFCSKAKEHQQSAMTNGWWLVEMQL